RLCDLDTVRGIDTLFPLRSTNPRDHRLACPGKTEEMIRFLRRQIARSFMGFLSTQVSSSIRIESTPSTRRGSSEAAPTAYGEDL
ncbi:MAG: hypothetical protein OXQ29_02725, partial [Rhodospirillaceae bacterium]|nr:hypothetical protein [Rhodospirillaceae bacterium]